MHRFALRGSAFLRKKAAKERRGKSPPDSLQGAGSFRTAENARRCVIRRLLFVSCLFHDTSQQRHRIPLFAVTGQNLKKMRYTIASRSARGWRDPLLSDIATSNGSANPQPVGAALRSIRPTQRAAVFAGQLRKGVRCGDGRNRTWNRQIPSRAFRIFSAARILGSRVRKLQRPLGTFPRGKVPPPPGQKSHKTTLY